MSGSEFTECPQQAVHQFSAFCAKKDSFAKNIMETQMSGSEFAEYPQQALHKFSAFCALVLSLNWTCWIL